MAKSKQFIINELKNTSTGRLKIIVEQQKVIGELKEEIDRLTTHRDYKDTAIKRLRKKQKNQAKNINLLVDKLKAKDNDCIKYSRVIQDYARHKHGCKMGEYNTIKTGKGCDCGLSQALFYTYDSNEKYCAETFDSLIASDIGTIVKKVCEAMAKTPSYTDQQRQDRRQALACRDALRSGRP